MGTFFCLIFCLLPVLVLANNDTDNMHYTNTSLFFEEEDHDYELLQEVDTDSSGDYFEDMILSRLETIDQTYV